MNKVRKTTTLFLRRGNQLLIAMKKRGFGAGLYNGVGGKVEPGETVRQCAIRECQEEIGVTPKHITLAGHLDFTDGDDSNVHFDMYIYECRDWEGEPQETEEMRPLWCDIDKLPFDKMWPGDEIWLPYFVAGKPFEGRMRCSTTKLFSHSIRVVSSVSEGA